MSYRVVAFRTAFFPIFAVVMALGLPLGFGVIVLQHGLKLNPVGLLVGAVAAFVFGITLTLLAILYFKVYLGPSGLWCYDFWGVYHEVTWADMVAVKSFNFVGLRYLRVYSSHHSVPLWVPLFLVN